MEMDKETRKAQLRIIAAGEALGFILEQLAASQKDQNAARLAQHQPMMVERLAESAAEKQQQATIRLGVKELTQLAADLRKLHSFATNVVEGKQMLVAPSQGNPENN